MQNQQSPPSKARFLKYKHWEEANRLLTKQVSLMEEGKSHFDTLSMRYYSSGDYKGVESEEYFKEIVKSQLFHGLSKRFRVANYPKPKSDGVRIRRYKFLSYQMRLLHYAVGIYIMELTKGFREEYYEGINNIDGRHGSSLRLDNDGRFFSVDREDIYFWNHYKEFASDTRDLINSGGKNRVILHFDITNYYDNISIGKLLDNVEKYNKDSVNIDNSYNENSKNTIKDIYNVISGGRDGIPQTDNNIISSFLGNLYMMYADLYTDNIVYSAQGVDDHYIIRWVDDTYLSIDFDKNINSHERDKLATNIAQKVSEKIVEKLGIRVNPKTRMYRPNRDSERGEFVISLLKTSFTEEFTASILEDFGSEEEEYFSHISDYPVGSAEEIIKVLESLTYEGEKSEDIKADFSRLDKQSLEALKMIYDRNVNNLMKSEKFNNRPSAPPLAA